MTHFADRLAAAVRARGNALCVGLDPRWESLPLEVRRRHGDDSLAAVAGAFEEFCLRVLDVVAPLVPAVKPQSAFFEACGPEGLRALQRVLARARQLGLLTILDAKRNDIASTAEAYADAAFAGTAVAGRVFPVWQADALTVNPYLGRDAVEPFLRSARRAGAGVFVLVRTSNPGSAEFQDVKLVDGRTWSEMLADKVAAVAAREGLVGASGWSSIGAVVGATQPQTMRSLRERLPQSIFLLPGYGAQGATADMTRAAFRDGRGALVSASRSILYAHREPKYADRFGDDWEKCVERAVLDMKADLARVIAR